MNRSGIALAFVLAGCAAEPAPPSGPVVTNLVEDWRDEVLYQLLTDRFANADPTNDTRVAPGPDRYHGGDWKGVRERLDYVQALGATAIWISPVVRNVDKDTGGDGYHGYWTLDFTRTNPHFGSDFELRELVRAAHARGLKVIVDVVVNHAGQVFFYDLDRDGVLDPGENDAPWSRSVIDVPLVFPQSAQVFPELFRYPESYHRRGVVTDWENDEQVLLADFTGGLKDLATERSDVREALVDIHAKWAIDYDFDGYRIDTLKHVEDGFWDEFCVELRRRLAAAGKRKFFLFGEAFDGNDGILGRYTRPGRLDAVLYFSQKFSLFDDVFGGDAPASRLAGLVDARARSYGSAPQPDGIGVAPRDALVGFIDNHDVPRFLASRNHDEGRKRLRAALAYLLTSPGVPCLYYGTEQELAGGESPANREDLWTGGYRTDGETFRFVAKVAAVRKAHPALRRGTFALRWASEGRGDEQDAGLIAFERQDGADVAIVVVNTGSRESETSLSASGGAAMKVALAEGSRLVDALGGGTYTVGAGGSLVVAPGPFGAAILVRAP